AGSIALATRLCRQTCRSKSGEIGTPISAADSPHPVFAFLHSTAPVLHAAFAFLHRASAARVRCLPSDAWPSPADRGRFPACIGSLPVFRRPPPSGREPRQPTARGPLQTAEGRMREVGCRRQLGGGRMRELDRRRLHPDRRGAFLGRRMQGVGFSVQHPGGPRQKGGRRLGAPKRPVREGPLWIGGGAGHGGASCLSSGDTAPSGGRSRASKWPRSGSNLLSRGSS